MPEQENTFAIDPNQPTQPGQQPPTANPLNTGNGVPAQVPAQSTTQEIDKKMEEELAKTETEQVEESNKPGKAKKYLIIAIVMIALLAGGYFAYGYFFSTPAEEDSAQNTLSESLTQDETAPSIDSPFSETKEEESTDKMKELEEVVDELENLYAPDTEVYDEAVLENVSDDNPPSLSQSEKPEEEQNKKILR